MTGAVDIRPPGEVDAEWLTSLLAANGIDAAVAGFTAKAIGTGQIGDSVRFRIDYAGAAAGAPASLVGKFNVPGKTTTSIPCSQRWRTSRFVACRSSTGMIVSWAS